MSGKSEEVEATSAEETKAHLDKSRTYWDKFAATYTERASAWTGALAASYMPMIQPMRCAKVLDLGCGPGNVAKLLHTSLPPEASITSMDLSPVMVEMARKALEPAAATRSIKVMEGDAQTIAGVEDASFDAIISNLCIFMAPDADATLRRMHEVLKPGGRVAFSVWGRPEHSLMFTLMGTCMKELGVTPEGASAPRRSNFHMGDVEATVQRVRDAGFQAVVGWRHMHPLATYSGEELLGFALKASPRRAKMYASVGEEAFARLKALFIKKAQAVIDSGKPVGLDVVVVAATKAVA